MNLLTCSLRVDLNVETSLVHLWLSLALTRMTRLTSELTPPTKMGQQLAQKFVFMLIWVRIFKRRTVFSIPKYLHINAVCISPYVLCNRSIRGRFSSILKVKDKQDIHSLSCIKWHWNVWTLLIITCSCFNITRCKISSHYSESC